MAHALEAICKSYVGNGVNEKPVIAPRASACTQVLKHNGADGCDEVVQESRIKELKDVTIKMQFHPERSEGALNIVPLLKDCAKKKDLGKGSELHLYVQEQKLLEKNSYVASALISMYASCNALAKAQQVLDELPVRDVVMWTALIAGYVQQGQGQEALQCFDNMQLEGHLPNAVTFICALKACGNTRAASEGEQIHYKIICLGLLEKDSVLGNTLVDMYARCGALSKAQQVFSELPVRNVVSWTALLSGYARQGQGEKALICFDSMLREGHSPNVVTFICALKACGIIAAVAKGEQIHDMIVSLGMFEKDIMLGNTLVDMYARCGFLAKAQKVLDELPVRNVVSWTSLVAGHARTGQAEEALKCFDIMQCEGHSPNAVTFVFALKACASIGTISKGEQIHDKIVDLCLLGKDIVLGSSLVDMYVRCGALAKAQQLLHKLPVRNVVTWNALIAGYAQQGQGEEALYCFDAMQRDGHTPDAITFVFVLKACGSLGAAAKGEQIHDRIANSNMLEQNILLGSTLVDMYASFGALDRVQQLHDRLSTQDMIFWTVLIGGYAQQAQSGNALDCFKRMQSKGFRPDLTTLLCVLNSCSHSGLLDHAEMYFSRMSSEYGIMPDVEHYSCMVDLFGRAGKFDKALVTIEKMPSDDYFPVWFALLGACRKWGDLKIGKVAFECAVDLDKSYAASYVCMAAISAGT